MSNIRYYSRGKQTLTVPAVLKMAPYLKKTQVRDRLIGWEKGTVCCDRLLRPIREEDTAWAKKRDIDTSDLGPRRKPEDIKITPFELEMGRQAEIKYCGGHFDGTDNRS